MPILTKNVGIGSLDSLKYTAATFLSNHRVLLVTGNTHLVQGEISLCNLVKLVVAG